LFRTPRHLERLDDRAIVSARKEILCFVAVRDEAVLLPQLLSHYRRLGVDRFFFLDNGSTDGTRELILEQRDCHCFHTEGSHFAENIDPPRWINTLMNVFGVGHWCLSVDSDEFLVFPEFERSDLRRLCDYLDTSGAEGVIGYLIDMYPDGPISNFAYDGAIPVIDAVPFFDSRPGWIRTNEDWYPSEQMFGGVRERAFWHGRFSQTLPPCLSKVPIVKWRHGRHYRVAQHTISPVEFSELRVALLHFKFAGGFRQKSASSLVENTELKEKTLEERAAYLQALQRNPTMSLRDAQSARYSGSAQLVELGWMRSSNEYEAFIQSVSDG
jgi:hypothetical protein